MKLCRHLVKGLIEWTMSQIFIFIGPSFHFMKCREKKIKNVEKVTRFF